MGSVCKRAAIFFFYDKDGIADRYIGLFLQELIQYVERLVIVCNGRITPSTRRMFLKYSDEIIVRENEGFDVWAHKTGLEYVGWDALREYDEVILTNHTMMGPIYPFSEMFDAMAARKFDFWGITKHYQIDFDPFECNPFGYIPEHIQSSFIVYSKAFMQKDDLKAYWDNAKMPRSYKEAVGLHETFFTKHFADLGYSWDVYVNTDEDKRLNADILVLEPVLLIKKYRCPVFKRRSFFQSMDYVLQNTIGQIGKELFNYLHDETSFNTDLILENIIRTCHASDFVENLALTYVLSNTELTDVASSRSLRIALLMHLHYMDLLDDSLLHAAAMPAYADIYVTTTSQENKEAIESVFSVLPNKIEVRIVKNRGRSESGLLIGLSDVVDHYDVACFWHDKKTGQVLPASVGKSFAYQTTECSLCSTEFVENVIKTFERNPYLGLLVTPEPYYNVYNTVAMGNGWGPNFDNTKALAEKMNLTVLMSPEKPPIASLGSVFYFRCKALKKLFDYGWTYDMMPPEPNNTDGTILHAIERIYPFVVQDAGYYPAYGFSDEYAAIEILALRHYVRNFNMMTMRHGIYGTNYDKINCLQSRLHNSSALLSPPLPTSVTLERRRKIKLWIKKYMPHWFYQMAVQTKRAILGPHGIE